MAKKFPKRHEVLELLKGEPRALHARQVAQRLEVAESRYLDLLALIQELAFDGCLRALPGQRYQARTDALAGPVDGTISINARGCGFVSSPGSDPDLFVPSDATGGAMNGDLVRVSVVARRREGRLEARVMEVLQRANQRVAGTLRVRRSSCWLEPDDPRILDPILVTEETSGSDGEACVVELTKFPEYPREAPQGRVIALLGAPGTAEAETKKILIRAGVSEAFSDEAKGEAEALEATWDERERTDLTHIPFVTIDPDDARDHDDAIWSQTTDDGFDIWVAIADVSHYVVEGSALDGDALARGFSVYLPDKAVPMLPEKLVSELCSLTPGTTRPCIGLHVHLDSKGVAKAASVCEGIMRSRARLTYGNVAAGMKWSERASESPDMAVREVREVIESADAAARVLRARRLRRGALDFSLPEAQVVLDPSGTPIDVRRRDADPGIRRAYGVVEELMVLANETIAQRLGEIGLDTIYRVHPPPDETKLQRLAHLCETLGIAVEPGQWRTPKKLASFLTRTAKHPRAQIIAMLALRSMKPATYDTTNTGHYGLASKNYVHFTSPIRRYPDIVVHRGVRSLIRGVTTACNVTQHTAMRCAQREREVVRVERDIHGLYGALLMQSRVGDLCEGAIHEIAATRVIVVLDDPFVFVHVPIDRLGNDLFEASADGVKLSAERSGRVLVLGDRVRVRIENISLFHHRIFGRIIDSERNIGTKDKPTRRVGNRGGQRANRSKTQTNSRQRRTR